jgi:hypothetical protein
MCSDILQFNPAAVNTDSLSRNSALPLLQKTAHICIVFVLE